MPPDDSNPAHPASLAEAQLLSECELRRTRRRGPGGQRRNKVETAVILRHQPTGVSAEASERRSAEQNRQMAAFRLRVNLALSVRRPWRDRDSPSELWRRRCGGGRIHISPTHEDFPSLLAEALDALAACAMNVSEAADLLGCSSSQLVKLLRLEPRALAMLNEHRIQAGLRPLS